MYTKHLINWAIFVNSFRSSPFYVYAITIILRVTYITIIADNQFRMESIAYAIMTMLAYATEYESSLFEKKMNKNISKPHDEYIKIYKENLNNLISYRYYFLINSVIFLISLFLILSNIILETYNTMGFIVNLITFLVELNICVSKLIMYKYEFKNANHFTNKELFFAEKIALIM